MQRPFYFQMYQAEQNTSVLNLSLSYARAHFHFFLIYPALCWFGDWLNKVRVTGCCKNRVFVAKQQQIWKERELFQLIYSCFSASETQHHIGYWLNLVL